MKMMWFTLFWRVALGLGGGSGIWLGPLPTPWHPDMVRNRARAEAEAASTTSLAMPRALFTKTISVRAEVSEVFTHPASMAVGCWRSAPVLANSGLGSGNTGVSPQMFPREF